MGRVVKRPRSKQQHHLPPLSYPTRLLSALQALSVDVAFPVAYTMDQIRPAVKQCPKYSAKKIGILTYPLRDNVADHEFDKNTSRLLFKQRSVKITIQK
jgi:hypothetical protein